MKDKLAETWEKVLVELGGAEPPEKSREYVAELVRWGGRMHLTGRERMADVIAAQISDSMIMLELAGGGPFVADIGAGAGFPGIVWKLANPGLELALFERKERLASFLERTVALLGLEGIAVRAEEATPETEGGPFDVVTSKAAGRLDEILPIAAGMLKKGGIYVTAKGEGWEREMDGATGFSPGRRAPLGGGRGEAVSLIFGR